MGAGLGKQQNKSPSLLGEGDCLRRARPDKSGLGLGGEVKKKI